MKFTLEWLKEFLDTSASVGEISDKLNQIGLEVDDITDKASELKDFNCVLVQEVKKHPESEHLNVCTVLKSDGCVLQIVCGAPNVKSGIKSILCPVGSTVPGLGVKITKSKIRGVESCGMLCSEKELGLGDDENGIIVLPDDVPLGKNIADIKGLDD
ncbi:MAG: phenylalanine--tRNA ligase subunit beta, partial [Rickettsiales bacterium]|nr:phenylalanine--tRNA ligase subunit beta [Rickettsiales bacterium]